MLKKITLALMLIIPMGVFAQNFKFGHVASQEIIMSMPEYTKARQELEALNKKYTEELQRSSEELQKKFQAFQQEQQGATPLPANIAERRQKEIQDMAQRNEEFQQEAYQNMEKTQQELMAPIYQKLESAIKTVGQEENMTYIFDLSRVAIPYVNESQSIDVTAKIKTKLGIK